MPSLVLLVETGAMADLNNDLADIYEVLSTTEPMPLAVESLAQEDWQLSRACRWNSHQSPGLKVWTPLSGSCVQLHCQDVLVIQFS
jgi:hypothetical protein